MCWKGEIYNKTLAFRTGRKNNCSFGISCYVLSRSNNRSVKDFYNQGSTWIASINRFVSTSNQHCISALGYTLLSYKHLLYKPDLKGILVNHEETKVKGHDSLLEMNSALMA